MTVWSEKKISESRGALKKAVIVLLFGEIGYWAYSAAPQAAHINGMRAFLPQVIRMAIVGVVYGLIATFKNKDQSPFTESVTYK